MSRRVRRASVPFASTHRRQLWLRIGIWVFIFVFAFSIVGGVIAVGTLGSR